MNIEMLKNAGVDYERGVKRFMGRANLFEKTLVRFTKDTTFSRIRAAYAAGDKAQLFAAAHEFKGMCGNIALASLFDAASAFVELLRDEDGSEAALAAAFSRLEREYQTVHEAVLAAMEETK